MCYPSVRTVLDVRKNAYKNVNMVTADRATAHSVVAVVGRREGKCCCHHHILKATLTVRAKWSFAVDVCMRCALKILPPLLFRRIDPRACIVRMLGGVSWDACSGMRLCVCVEKCVEFVVFV